MCVWCVCVCVCVRVCACVCVCVCVHACVCACVCSAADLIVMVFPGYTAPISPLYELHVHMAVISLVQCTSIAQLSLVNTFYNIFLDICAIYLMMKLLSCSGSNTTDHGGA